MLALALALACGSSPTPPDQLPARLDDVEPRILGGWLDDLGFAVEVHGDVLRVAVPDDAPEATPLAVTVHVDARARAVLLVAGPLVTLDDAPDDDAVGRVLTEVAVRNYDRAEGKLQLDPESGAVLLSVELETDEGLGRPTFEAGLKTLVAESRAARPALAAALGSARPEEGSTP